VGGRAGPGQAVSPNETLGGGSKIGQKMSRIISIAPYDAHAILNTKLVIARLVCSQKFDDISILTDIKKSKVE
jgi:hypothetical protein